MFDDGIRQNDEILIAEKVQDPQVIARQPDSQLMYSVFQIIRVGSREIRSSFLQGRDCGKYLGLVSFGSRIDEFLDRTLPIHGFIVEDMPHRLHPQHTS